MALFFHLVELDGGRWSCRQGRHEFDAHDDMDSAVDHITRIAAEHVSAEVYLHALGKPVRRVGAVDETGAACGRPTVPALGGE